MKGHAIRRWFFGCALGASFSLGGAVFALHGALADPPPPLTTLQGPVLFSPEIQPPVHSAAAASGTQAVPKVTLGFDDGEPSAAVSHPQLQHPKMVMQIYPAETIAPSPAQPSLPQAKLLPPFESAKTVGPQVMYPRHDPGPQRKNFTDLTAAPCFAHAPDYQWIVGRAEYSNVTKEWRIRYASVDEVDRYGGRVTLVPNQHVEYLSDGIYIHVRGHLVNSDNAGKGPAFYRMEWFEHVPDPNTFQPKNVSK